MVQGAVLDKSPAPIPVFVECLGVERNRIPGTLLFCCFVVLVLPRNTVREQAQDETPACASARKVLGAFVAAVLCFLPRCSMPCLSESQHLRKLPKPRSRGRIMRTYCAHSM